MYIENDIDDFNNTYLVCATAVAGNLTEVKSVILQQHADLWWAEQGILPSCARTPVLSLWWCSHSVLLPFID